MVIKTFKLFLIALTFFTRIPIRFKGDVSQEEFFKSMLFLPIIGLVLGIILLGIALLIHNVKSINIQAVLLLISYLALTGGLHLDGLADTSDAIFSAKDKEKMFEIMKDSRLGTFGAVVLILLLLANFSGFTYVFESRSYSVLLIMPIIGRYCALQLGAFSKAVPTGGLGEGFSKVDKPLYSVIYFIVLILLLILLKQYKLIISSVLTIIISLFEIPYFKRTLGGITGDLFGFTIELTQTLFLYISLIIPMFWSF